MAQTTRFDLEEFLPYRLNQAAEAASRTFQTIYRQRYGMTRTEWRVLAHLGQFGAMTASEISSRAALHKTKVSRAVFALEKRKWLSRRRDEKDRRSEWLALTRAGSDAFRDLGEVALDHDAALLSLLEPREIEILRNALRKLTFAR